MTIGSEKEAKYVFCEYYIFKKIRKLSSNILIDSKSDFRSLVFISWHVSIAQNKGNSRIPTGCFSHLYLIQHNKDHGIMNNPVVH